MILTLTPGLRLTADLTEQFETRDVRWAPDGKGIVLLDKETFCCAFEVENGDPMEDEPSFAASS